MPKDCDSAPLGSSLLLLETLPRGHVLGQARLRWESLSVGFCFGVKAGSFIRSVSCQGIHQGLGVGKNCEDGGTGEKSSEKLRPVTLMFRARTADPESLCRPPSFGLGSVSYTIFWCTQAKVLQVTIQKWRHTVLSLCWADCAAMALKPGDQARGCFRPYYLLFTLHSHVLSWLPGSAAHAKGPGASFLPRESLGQCSSQCCVQGTDWRQRRAGILNIKTHPIPLFF